VRDEAVDALRALNEVVERLRAPGGCPWDREQTHRSLRPYLLEETYEVLEAIDSLEPGTLREELGDLLLQVLMHSAIAQEEDGGFDIGDVADDVRVKMIHRHPHVFGDVTVDGPAGVVVNWEKLKKAEKRERLSLLDGVPAALPALAHAQGVQKRPARIGFDETPTVPVALDSVRHALGAVEQVAGGLAEAERGEDWASEAGDPEVAIGNLLFAVVALARRLRVNPEEALRGRTMLFARRFRALETQAREDGVDLHELDDAGWRERWEATDAREGRARPGLKR
jgi:tetrapyrrole methylase family protein/MazG family protein